MADQNQQRPQDQKRPQIQERSHIQERSRDQKQPRALKDGQVETGAAEAASHSALQARLETLKAELGAAEDKEDQAARARPNQDGGAIGKGLRAGSELLAGILVGCGIGYVLDRQLGTAPWFLIIFMMFGMIAGFWNVYRLSATSGPGRPGRG